MASSMMIFSAGIGGGGPGFGCPQVLLFRCDKALGRNGEGCFGLPESSPDSSLCNGAEGQGAGKRKEAAKYINRHRP